jgi:hypothetical protein
MFIHFYMKDKIGNLKKYLKQLIVDINKLYEYKTILKQL